MGHKQALKKVKNKRYKFVNENFSYNSFNNKNYLTVPQIKKIITNM